MTSYQLIVISNMIFVSCSFGLSALMDIPIVVSKGAVITEGIVVKGSNIESSNKLECYNVVVEEKDNGKLYDLNLYWENGIHKDDLPQLNIPSRSDEETEGTDRAWDRAKSVCSGGSTEGATLCAWVQGMQYPCAGQGRQPCPVKWRFAT